MDKGSDCSNGICVIHSEVKEGQIKYLTHQRLEKIVKRREQWNIFFILSLSQSV